MKIRLWTFPLLMLAAGFLPEKVNGQNEKPWTLNQCIDYALKQNIQVRQSYLNSQSNEIYLKQAKAERFPSASALARENIGWNKDQNVESSNNVLHGSSGTSYSLNTSMILFNGMKISNTIEQAMMDYEIGNYNSEAIKESVSLTIMDAYVQILYAEENVSNSQKQVSATEEQLKLAEERLAISIISQSDYLQVKSELANEKLTLANAESQLNIARVNLMQLMEMPVSPHFKIANPAIDSLINQHLTPDPQEIYQIALGIKPQIKSAELNTQSNSVGVKIAKANFSPSVTLDAGIGTGYSSIMDLSYPNQLDRKINPAVALSVNIPIYQNRQAKTRVELADIAVKNARLDEIDTKNQLRKNIEQACVDVSAAQSQYEASVDQYEAANESYAVTEEKFNQGMINSIDFLVQKTNQIVAESKLLQSKYNLIFSYKILDFYLGKPLAF